MVQSIMVSGTKKALEREKVYRYGKMEVNIKGTGRMIELMVKEDLSTKMAIATMENGLTTKPMVVEPMNTRIAPNTLEIGKRISNMDMELRHGLIWQSMRATMNMEKSMASVLSNGVIAQIM